MVTRKQKFWSVEIFKKFWGCVLWQSELNNEVWGLFSSSSFTAFQAFALRVVFSSKLPFFVSDHRQRKRWDPQGWMSSKLKIFQRCTTFATCSRSFFSTADLMATFFPTFARLRVRSGTSAQSTKNCLLWLGTYSSVALRRNLIIFFFFL